MFKIPKKVQERFSDRIRPFQKIAEQQKAKDVSEADTVTVVKDILAEVFGYDKYQELTSEHQIKGTFCDLAVKIDKQLIDTSFEDIQECLPESSPRYILLRLLQYIHYE